MYFANISVFGTFLNQLSSYNWEVWVFTRLLSLGYHYENFQRLTEYERISI
jgi:hypothetical protein